MGKMKMMAFFKNPIVKNAFIVLTTIMIVASIVSVPISKADTQIKVAFRASSMGVTAGSRDIEIPELAPGQGEQATKAKKYTSIFCIDEGRKLSYEEYTSEINVYNSEESNKYFTNYGSALWLFDNMYLAKGGNKDIALSYLAELVTSPDVAKNFTSYGKISANDIKSLNKTVGGKKDKYGNTLNRNFIEVIEQLVLWNYTNNTGNVNPDTLVSGGFSGAGITNEDQNKAKYLYHALKYLADKNSNYKSNGSVSNVISLDSSKAAIDIKNNKVGPYVLKANGVTLNINDEYKAKIHATVTKTDGSTQELDSSKIIEEDGKFYINISGCGEITKSNLKIDEIYTGTKTTVEVLTSGKTQNLVNVRKSASTKPLSDEKTVSYSGIYDVRLIKTKADGSTSITNNPAVFTIKGAVEKEKVKTSMDGILNIAVNQPITSATATDTYTIVEDEAPKGFTKYDGTITLNVKFKLEGTTFLIDKENTKVSGDGKNGTVKLNYLRDNVVEIYVPNTEQKREVPEFDLALRKYISKVDGKAVEESREPVIDSESKSILDQFKTAAYHHTKKALTVKVGSEVEYTIRIYNEGKVDGYAKEITDYLPAGLSFVKLADDSSKLYSTDAKPDSKKIVIEYLGNDVIKADSIGRIINKETENLYQEVKMICKVNDGYTGYITNRAEITNYGYKDSKGAWKEAKAIGDSDRDSVQNTISGSLGLDTWYEKAKVYTYTDNGTTKTIKNYYPGVQDDDDFETVEVLKEKIFDLSLRKFITNVNGKEITSRIPQVTITDDFKSGKETDAIYTHPKDPVSVETDDIVTYTIRVYNEGNEDGYASKIMDDIPDGLEFLPTNGTNTEYAWKMYAETSNAKAEGAITYNKKVYAPTTDASKADLIVTDYLDNQLIKGYDAETMKTFDFKDVKVAFKVVEPNTSDRVLTNYAQITEHKDSEKDSSVTDRDSTPNEWIDEDDDQDTEKIKLQNKIFDLSLRKFITNIDGKEITSRIPKVTLTDDFKSGKVTTATYDHPKDPIEVVSGNIVTYTIRVYNEGEESGYASKIMDDIPDGLELIPAEYDENGKPLNTNAEYKWVAFREAKKGEMVALENSITYNGKSYVATTNVKEADLIVTNYLNNQLIKAYDAKTMDTLDYKDVKVSFKVVEPNNSDRIITNYAQITEHKDSKGNTAVTDRDSTPNEWIDKEDDQDIENIKLQEKDFDLSLRKFITNVNGKEITSRIPTVTLTDDFKAGKVTTATYEHPKDPVDVVNGNIVTYTIRVYNEGQVDGYATKVMDDIPEGLEFLPSNETNTEYAWKMYAETSNANVEGAITYNKKVYAPTTDASKADLIITDYLKDQIIKAYDANTMETLDYKDVKVAFKVVEPNTSDRILVNYAQITEHKDSTGKTTVIDRDSTPNEWIDGEDDQDVEKIRLRYFDLSLRKWVTEAIITENGQTKVVQTGHKAEDDPEDIVKVDLKKSKLNDVTVKFRYSIRVTNEGELAGYAKEVSDYIPEGLVFDANDNPGWTQKDDNTVTTDALANILLNPGESTEVTIVLTWVNSATNMGVKTNTAEISEDYNDYGAEDIDSTPGNKVPDEDDIDIAPVMLSVKTGSAIIGFVTLAVGFLAIIGTGVYTIKRRIV